MTLVSHISQASDPRLILLGGGFAIFWGTVELITGETMIKFEGIIKRTENPNKFWFEISITYLIGIALVCYYVYRVFFP